ncbi:MAG: M48 family metallopeptidase [Methyloversatilis sp.]|nr:M48 family metallopeptidase [Methyloversatilis sp.]MBP6193691.1 M48 family metallopeptidase [Methyloversatilis sp.]MBP9117349.1 M48 family metallopeptidase [Methyloversatilis sp.]
MSISLSDPPVDIDVTALYFDGRSARAHVVTLRLAGELLQVVGAEVSRSDALGDVRLSEPMGLAPRLITFADGAHLEVRDHASLARLLAATGQRDAAHVRWAFDPRTVLLLLGVLLVSLWLTGRYGLPWAARMAAPHVPEAAVSALSVHTLEWFDQEVMTPSSLPPQRRDVLVQALRDHAVADGRRIEHTLLFRNGGPLGANAFALPDGTVIVTDELIALAEGDDEVLAVLSHELGHVQLRHGVRLLLQSSATALFMAWYFGDVGGLLASAPTLLVQAGYSRGMEGEADDFAVRMLRERGQSPALLAGMLEKLRAAHGGAGAGAWLSSHPDSAERIERLRKGDFTVN